MKADNPHSIPGDIEANLQKELPRADTAAHLANGIAHSEDMMGLYLRYNNQFNRQYLRCLKELRELQSSRPPTNTDRKGGDVNPPELIPNEPNPEIEHPEHQPSEPPVAAQPNEANLTPEQARLEYMKAEIQRFEDYRARLLNTRPAGK